MKGAITMKRHNTAEKHYRRQLIAVGVLGAVWTLVALAILIPLEADASYAAFPFAFLIILFGSLAAYFAVQYFRWKNAEFTHVQEVKLERVCTYPFFRFIGFEIEVEKDGMPVLVTTKPVFTVRTPIDVLTVDEFSGTVREVGYCEAADQWVVLL